MGTDAKAPMILALGGGWLLFLPLAFVFGTTLDGGIVGAWFGATIYVVALGISMFAWLKAGRWRRIRLAPTMTEST